LHAVAATLWVEEGIDGEKGRAVFMQQGNHRCILSGCIYDRSLEDATWEALSVWAEFEPSPGRPKQHKEILFFPETLTHEMELAWNQNRQLGKTNRLQSAVRILSHTHSRLLAALPEVCDTTVSRPVVNAPQRFQSYARAVAISRLRPVQDGLAYWQRITASPPPLPLRCKVASSWEPFASHRPEAQVFSKGCALDFRGTCLGRPQE
jgi:hypothetical protein